MVFLEIINILFRFIVNPENVYSILQNEEYRKSSSRLEAVQVRVYFY